MVKGILQFTGVITLSLLLLVGITGCGKNSRMIKRIKIN